MIIVPNYFADQKRLASASSGVLKKMIGGIFALLLLQAFLLPSAVDADHWSPTESCPDTEAKDYVRCMCN